MTRNIVTDNKESSDNHYNNSIKYDSPNKDGVVTINLKQLKRKSPEELQVQAENLNIENSSALLKQELVFAILKKSVEQGDLISGEGVLEILPDGFGFLRSPEVNYSAGPDDIYISPSQIRRFGLRTGGHGRRAN